MTTETVLDLFMDTIFSISKLGIRPAIVLKSKNLLTQDKLEKIIGTKITAGDYFCALIKKNFPKNLVINLEP